MQKVNLVGERCFNRFRDTYGNATVEWITDAAYEALSGANPTLPSKEGATWTNSGKTYRFDTIDGLLHDGEYAEVSEGSFAVFDDTFGFVITGTEPS